MPSLLSTSPNCVICLTAYLNTKKHLLYVSKALNRISKPSSGLALSEWGHVWFLHQSYDNNDVLGVEPSFRRRWMQPLLQVQLEPCGVLFRYTAAILWTLWITSNRFGASVQFGPNR